ncbi:unnamed protein product, partial [Meganyctiphanes norvegica]
MSNISKMSNISYDTIHTIELYNSCASGNCEDVQKLLLIGASPMPSNTAEKEFPLYITCMNGFYKVLDLLLDRLKNNGELLAGLKVVDKYGNSLFHTIMKCISKRKTTVETFNSVDHKKCMVSILKCINHEKYDKFIFIKENEHNLLLDACDEGQTEFVDRLLKDGADPTKYCKFIEKKFAIHIAGSKGYIEIFRKLINKLKDLSKLQYGIQQKDNFGNSVLHTIVKGLEKTLKSSRKKFHENRFHDEEEINKFVECMRVLLPKYKDYVDIDAVNNGGNTALHTAVLLQKFHAESILVEILCDNGAKCDIKNKEGKYAVIGQYSNNKDDYSKGIGTNIKTDALKREEDLYNACELCSIDKVKCYIEDADGTIFLTGKIYNTAIQMAFSKGCFQIVDILIQNMKKKLDVQEVIAIIKKLSNNIKKQNESRTENEEPKNFDYNKCIDIIVEHNHLFTDILYAACNAGDVNIVNKLICKGVYPTVPCDKSRKYCPIIAAFKNGYYDIADILLTTTKNLAKLEDAISEDMVNYIISLVIDGEILEKEKMAKYVTKQGDRKCKLNIKTQNDESYINYGEAFGVLLEHFDLRDKNKILYDACEKGLPCLVQKLIDFNVDPAKICKNKMESYSLIIAAKKGYSDILEIILSQLEENQLRHCLKQNTDRFGRSVLHVILRRDKENSGSEYDYMKCMDILLKYKQYFDIDAKDHIQNTALHYAVRLRGDWTFAKTLIKNGACINVKNREGTCVMDKIPVKILENILNECIEESNFSNDRENENYKIKMNFSIFSHMESFQTRSELELIKALQKSQPHHHLLYHPLITAFVHIKWQKIRHIWYLNLLYNLLFFFLIFFYIFYYERYLIINGVIDKDMEMSILPLKIVITILGSFLMLKEIAQCIIFKWEYFKSFDNYLEVTILVLTCTMLFTENINLQHSIAAWLIVFITMEMILLFEKMHLLKMAIYISMFKKVTLNFVKLTILLSWMVLAFGVSFRLLCQNIEVAISDENGNKFATWGEAFLKTLVMSIGELDFYDFKFDRFPIASRLLFVVFIFSIVLVAMNLLNGIAISNIQDIQNDACNYQIRDQVECITNFDQLAPVYRWLQCLNVWKRNQIFECCFPDKVIESIHPNRHYSKLWVRCKGHKDYYSNRFYFLRVYRWFKSLLNTIRDCQCTTCCNERIEQVQNMCTQCNQSKNIIRCSICGEEKMACIECQVDIWKDEHKCIYEHTYLITKTCITKVKKIKTKEENNKVKRERKNTKELHEKKLNNLNTRITNLKIHNENRFHDIQNSNNDIIARLANIENCLMSLS